jgi:hypothetical protein
MRRRSVLLAPVLVLVGLIAAACVPSPPLGTQTTNWAGYVVDARSSAQPLRRVAGHFTVPAVQCTTANATVSLWVGLDGVLDPQQTPGGKGRPLYQTGIGVACGAAGSRPLYYAWTEAAPAPAHNLSRTASPVRAGDVFDAYVTVIGPASGPQVQMQLVNHGPSIDPSKVLWHYSTQTAMVGGTPLTAECITERDTDGTTGQEYPLAGFKIAVWGDPSTDGCQVSNRTAASGQRPIYRNPYGWLVVPNQMLSDSNVLLANVSGFTTLKSGKQAFQVAGYAPYNANASTPRAADSLTTPPPNIRYRLAR